MSAEPTERDELMRKLIACDDDKHTRTGFAATTVLAAVAMLDDDSAIIAAKDAEIRRLTFQSIEFGKQRDEHKRQLLDTIETELAQTDRADDAEKRIAELTNFVRHAFCGNKNCCGAIAQITASQYRCAQCEQKYSLLDHSEGKK